MIIQHFTDNDLYKFTTMYAIQKLYPHAKVKYKFFNRGNTNFPAEFADLLKEEIKAMAKLRFKADEEQFMRENCYYFDPVFIDFLRAYTYDPNEVSVSVEAGNLHLEIEGYWFRTVLWEVPLMAIISELYFKLTGHQPIEVESKASSKALTLSESNVKFSEFGTRRRFSYEVQNRVLKTLISDAGSNITGTSNLHLAKKFGITPIGTHPHEWFMYHAAHYGYRQANFKSLEAWTDVYKGSLGVALTDTYTTDNFFQSFELQQAKLFDGLRWDSGDPIEFTQKALEYYAKNRIDSKTKIIVYSDSLNLETIKKIKAFTRGKINDVYGIGTYFSNDVGIKPLNMVIKLTHAAPLENMDYYHTVKLSDVIGKNTGDATEIELCKRTLNIA